MPGPLIPALGAVNEQLWWYVARSSGMVAWAALTLSVVVGLLQSTRLGATPSRSARVLDLHRFLSALSLWFLAIHLAGLVGDSYVSFGVAELLVPGASSWRPGAVAWGVVAMYLLVAIQLSSLVKKRIPPRMWRTIHLTAFAVYVFATVHTITAGTDRTNPIFRWCALASVQLVLVLTIVRLFTTRRMKRAHRAAGPAGSSTRRSRESPGRPADVTAAVPEAMHPEVPASAGAGLARGGDASPVGSAVDAALTDRLEALRARRSHSVSVGNDS